MAILFCALLLLSNYAFAAEEESDQLHGFLKNDMAFKRWVGGGLMLVSLLGLWSLHLKLPR